MKKIIMFGLLVGISLSAANVNKCMNCHGTYFEKHALGKSKIVKDMSTEEIAQAIKGYQDGTYGGTMKGLMKGQVINMDPYETAKLVKDRTLQVEPKTFKEKKQECVTKIEDVLDCVNNANTKEDMGKCKDKIKKINEHILLKEKYIKKEM